MSEDTKMLMSVAAVVVVGAVGLALVGSCAADRSATGATQDLALEPQREAESPVATSEVVYTAMPFVEPRDTLLPAAEPAGPEIPSAAEQTFHVDPGEDFVARGLETYRAREFDRSAAYFKAQCERLPGRAWNHYMLGLALWKSGQPDQAAEEMRRSAELDTSFIKTPINLSRIENERGDFEAALEAAQQALALDIADPTALFVEGRSLRNLGRREEALEALAASVDIDPENAHTLSLYGLTLIELGREPEAVEALARAVQLDPEVGYIHNNLGMALERSGRTGEALAAYRRAIEVDPDHERAMLNVARVEPLVPGERLEADAVIEVASAIEPPGDGVDAEHTTPEETPEQTPEQARKTVTVESAETEQAGQANKVDNEKDGE